MENPNVIEASTIKNIDNGVNSLPIGGNAPDSTDAIGYVQENGLTGYEKRLYCAADVDSFMKSRGISKTDIGNIFSPGGLSSSAFIRKIGTGSDLLPPPLQILFRMYLRHPSTIPLPERVSASTFFDEELGGEDKIATRYRGVLFGVDRNSGYNWSKNSAPISHVQATMLAAKRLRATNSLSQEALLTELLDITNVTTSAMQVNPMKVDSWKRASSKDDVLVLTPENVSNKNVKMRGLRVNRKSTAVGDEFKRLRELIDLVKARLPHKTR